MFELEILGMNEAVSKKPELSMRGKINCADF